MEPNELEERVLELHWQQTAARRWLAVIIDQQTGERWEVCSPYELQATLKSVMRGEATGLASRSPAAGIAID